MDGRAAAARGTGRKEEALTLRIGVFGGTFDPVHVGHLAIALAALESVPLDRVLFVPVRRSPLKDRDPTASIADRVTMLEAAIASEPRFAISRAELERYGGGDVHELIRRSFEFLLDHEANTSILPEFDLGTIERYFPDYPSAMKKS